MKKYNWINDAVIIDFPLPQGLLPLINKLEVLDASEDYAYFNYSEALDNAAKELVVKGRLSIHQWDLLCAKYDGGES